ncbi:hypothetical protein Y032_0095g2860 [Ancylostoma ceylanicum]|nr:hypothetical protein Y032_0095g2860 [Ancylostoma ceylanicum]
MFYLVQGWSDSGSSGFRAKIHSLALKFDSTEKFKANFNGRVHFDSPPKTTTKVGISERDGQAEKEKMRFGISTKYMVEAPFYIPKHCSNVRGPKIRHRFCNNLT